MKVTKFRKNEKGGWEEYTIEEEGGFTFSTHTNVPIEKLKSKKSKDKIKKKNEQ